MCADSVASELGGKPLQVETPKDWKTRSLDWIFQQGSIAIVLMAWLGWTIYSGIQIEKARIVAAEVRQEWEESLWSKIDVRLSHQASKLERMSDEFTKNLEKIISANERKTERDEIRFDKIVDRIKGQ